MELTKDLVYQELQQIFGGKVLLIVVTGAFMVYGELFKIEALREIWGD